MMAAKGFFVPMARSGRIPKKAKVKEEDKGEEGGRLLQVLGSREVDLVQKILNFLDPVSLMRLEFTGASMRNFIINQKTWGVRVKRENKILEDPAVMSRLGTGTLVDKVDKTSANHKEKVKAVRAWNLRQNWKFGQVKRVKLVSFNCNHDGCGAKCHLRVRVTLNPPNPQTEDLLPSQVEQYAYFSEETKRYGADYKWRLGGDEYL